jgi:hypothetical protein
VQWHLNWSSVRLAMRKGMGGMGIYFEAWFCVPGDVAGATEALGFGVHHYRYEGEGREIFRLI